MADQPALKRNFALGVANGALYHFGIAILSPEVILPVYIATLASMSGWEGAANVLAGLLSMILQLGWFLPQLFVADLIQSKPYKLPVYRKASVLRVSTLILLIGMVWELGAGHPRLLIVATILLLGLYGVFGGISGSAFMDVVGKSIPPGMRGRFFGLRMFIGGLLGLVAGQIVRFIQGMGLPFPKDHLILFAVAASVLSAALLCFSLVEEPPGVKGVGRVGVWRHLRRAPSILRTDRNFRRFTLVRLGFAFTSMSTPFFTLYAVRVLGIPPEMKGTFISILALSGILSNPLWSYLSDKVGKRVVMIAGAGTLALSPAIPLITRFIPPEGGGDILSLLQPLTSSENPVHNFYCLTFMMAGVGRMGYNIANLSYLLDISPEEERPTYVGLMNTLTAPMMLVPMLGGYLIDLTAFEVVFSVSALSGLITAWLAFELEEGREPSFTRPTSP